MEYTYRYCSPLGGMTIVSDGESIISLWFDEPKYDDATLDEEYAELKTDAIVDEIPVLHQAIKWLDIYFQGQNPDFELPLKPKGNEFRKSVWNILLQIPYGETTTYGAIAKIIAAQRGLPKFSAQAVGNAVGHNPIGMMIPCHRVIGADGSLTGYAAGLDKKKALLELEGIL